MGRGCEDAYLGVDTTTMNAIAEWVRTPQGLWAAAMTLQLAWWRFGTSRDGRPRWSVHNGCAAALALLLNNAAIGS